MKIVKIGFFGTKVEYLAFQGVSSNLKWTELGSWKTHGLLLDETLFTLFFVQKHKGRHT